MFIGKLILIWELINILITLLAPTFIPYLGFFSYGDTMYKYGLPAFIRTLSNFDGIMYIRIALNGYSTTEQAYFPLYPLFIRYINLIIRNPITSGILISHLAFFVGVFIFNKYLKTLFKKNIINWVILFLFAYPTAYYFGVMYTESLFFLLFISSLFFLKKKKFFLACVLAYLVALTRVVGVFILVPIFFLFSQQIYKSKLVNIKAIILKNWQYILIILCPIAGLVRYCLYLWNTTGDPLYFFHTQKDFGAHRSTSLIFPPQVIYRYLKIFITADKNFQYFVAVLEFCFYIFTLIILLYDFLKIKRARQLNFERLGFNIFSFINILLPSLTGTLTAVPRYSLLSFSIFFVLAEITNKLIKFSLLIFFILLHIILFAFFIQGYYVT